VQSESPPEIRPRPAWTLPLDIIIAPRRAYLTIAVTRAWWPGVAIALAATIAYTVLVLPAFVAYASTQSHGAMPVPSPWSTGAWLPFVVGTLWIVLGWSIVASLFANMTIGGAQERRSEYWGLYRTYFALAATAAIPSALFTVVQGLAVAAHPAAGYHSLGQILNALPLTLAVLGSATNPREMGFLSAFDPTTLWGIVLVAYGAHAIGGIKLVWALIVPCAVTLAIAFLSILS
jgi:hypothetical protein